MFQFFSSFGASSTFEKYRLEITARNFEAPSEQSLRGIMLTFSGQDPQTKSQIGFATIVKKLLSSDSKGNWLYVVKNLIILDRMVEEGWFAEEVAGLALPALDAFREADQRNLPFDSERVVASFWRLVREKSAVLAKNAHVFCYKRSQRTDFLSKLTPQDLLAQIQSIEGFFSLAFELVGCLSGKRVEGAGERGREEWERSRLLEFLYLQVLHKLMLFYSCQLLCHQAFLQVLPREHSLGVEEVVRFKRHVLKFRQNANEYVRFVEARKHIKGFEELNYKELNPFKGDDIVRLLDAFIAQKEKEAATERPVFQHIVSEELMRVEKKPFAELNKAALVPRIKQREEGREERGNCFRNWSNSFSNSFPQSEVLSVDLIMEMRREEEREKEEKGKENLMELEAVVEEVNRESVMYGNRDTNISADYEVSYKLLPRGMPVAFRNEFSGLASKWNQ